MFNYIKKNKKNHSKSEMAAPVRFELTHDGTKTRCLAAWLWGKMVEGEGFEPPNREEVGYSHPRLAASLPLHFLLNCFTIIKQI